MKNWYREWHPDFVMTKKERQAVAPENGLPEHYKVKNDQRAKEQEAATDSESPSEDQ